MNSNEFLQRLNTVQRDELSRDIEIATTIDGRCIVARESESCVRWRRGYTSVGIGIAGCLVMLGASALYASMIWLLVELAIIGFGYAYWYVKRIVVVSDEKYIHFEIDTQQRTLTVLGTPSKPQTQLVLDIDLIQYIYSWHVSEGDSSDYSVRCTYGKRENFVLVMKATSLNVDQYARLLGLLCGKEVWKRDVNKDFSVLLGRATR